MKEIWIPLRFTGNCYEVSNHGRVRRILSGPSTAAGRILIPRSSRNGYSRVSLNNKSVGLVKKTFNVHRLVALTFIGKPRGRQVNHINGIKSDNRVENLEFVSASVNAKHAFNIGLRASPRGQSHYRSLFSNEDVAAIRGECSRGVPQKYFVDKFKVSPATICNIVRGNSWKHVKERLGG